MTSKSKTVSLPLASGRKKKFFLERIKGIGTAYAPNSSVAKVFIKYDERGQSVLYQLACSINKAREVIFYDEEN